MDIDIAYPSVKVRAMEFKTWIEARRGRAAEVAAHLRIPASFVSKMAAGEKAIPLAHMAEIEALSCGAVTRQEMRPDDWSRIWPELASPGAARSSSAIEKQVQGVV